MTLEEKIRSLIAEGAGRAPMGRVIGVALGLPTASGDVARRLALAAIAPFRDLRLDGDDVVCAPARSAPARRAVALAVAGPPSATLLPPRVAWCAPGGVDVAVAEPGGPLWLEEVRRLGSELAGTSVLALSAGTSRRLLRLAARQAELEAGEEPEVIALAPVARALGHVIRSAEDAAALVGQPVPERPERAARVLAELVERLAEDAGLPPARLGEVVADALVPEYDFGSRSFARADVLALPESPGIYVFEDARGEIAYVGKAVNLRRRVSSYFASDADERAQRVRDAAQTLRHEPTGTELSALLREHELIRDFLPALNVQSEVHARHRSEGIERTAARFAVIQGSAEGGAEIVLADRRRGVTQLRVLPSPVEQASEWQSVVAAIHELTERPATEDVVPEVEIVRTWLADKGTHATVVDASGPPEEAGRSIARLARDPDLREGRIVPV